MAGSGYSTPLASTTAKAELYELTVWQVSECNGRSDGGYVENRKVSTCPTTAGYAFL